MQAIFQALDGFKETLWLTDAAVYLYRGAWQVLSAGDAALNMEATGGIDIHVFLSLE
jgi:hypothetical protein